ncbi:MAG: hypothetical protein BAA04_12345 [Firmicutes bacterium ZCTH02-B6]|nr:MAG: hypothetical protein BAA04_12345 [Firmicutes bacterium ZCTH02-B6]
MSATAVRKERKRIAEILREQGLISEEQVRQAIAVQQRSRKRLGEILVDLGFVGEHELADALARQTGYSRVHLDQAAVPREVLELVPRELLERYDMFPVALDGDRLLVAMADPSNVLAQDDARAASGRDIVPLVASTGEIRRALGRHFAAGVDWDSLQEWPGGTPGQGVADDLVEEPLVESPTIRLVDAILVQGIREGASDIHIQPEEDRVRVRYRVDGRLRDAIEFSRRVAPDVVSRLKVMASLDITVQRKPQDGRLRVKVDGAPVDVRISTIPTIHGEKVVLRVLNRSHGVISLDRMPFQPENMKAVRSMLRQPQGLILVTGPTGSGKTTTLYSFLHALNAPDVNIITVEDPVEMRIPGLVQVALHPKGGVTFAGALRAILRQDPDIVMVGEMRDAETAELAVRAALTGHMVLSTLHTNSAAGAVTRLLDMGVEPFMLSGTLVGIVAQRLVRRLCRGCRKQAETLNELEADFLGRAAEGATLYRAVGCPRCGGTGYSGRTVVEEALLVSREVRRLVRDGADEAQIAAAARAAGMVTLRESTVRLVVAGDTTVDEVMRSIYTVDDLAGTPNADFTETGEGAGDGDEEFEVR